MAATELQQLGCNKGTVPDEEEAQSPNSGSKRGGWITFPFVTGTIAGLNLASWGWTPNLIVYLIGEFNMKSIDAAQVSNVINGCTYIFTVVGAIIADSFAGCFTVISFSSCLSLLGIFLLGLTATFTSLRPEPCEIGSSLCRSTSGIQFAILYTGITLASLGVGGTRFVLATMGANQFDKPNDQGIFFNWYFITLYTSAVISITGIVYIEDNVGWAWGLGLCLLVNTIGLVVFLLGKRFYRHVKPQGSPFEDLARVVVATIRKRKTPLSSNSEDYYYHNFNGVTIKKVVAAAPSRRFRFLNHAAIKTKEDIQLPDGSIAKTWRLCTVQQVEDFKALIRIFPIVSTCLFLTTPIAMLTSLVILQALSMDRHLGPHFKIPAGSILVILLVSSSISLTVIDRFLIPTWQKLTGQYPTPLQRVGVGHVFNVLSMVVSALVEAKRLRTSQSQPLKDLPGSNAPMLALWLFPQLILNGIGEAFHFPGQVALYYQEFPTPLKNTATAMNSLIIGISFYLSTALIDLVRRITGWLPDDINHGRLDNVYWMLVVVGVLNFGYYLVWAKFYKYQNVVERKSESPITKVDG